MRYELTTWNDKPAITVRLNHEEAREYYALDPGALAWVDESEPDGFELQIVFYPYREHAEQVDQHGRATAEDYEQVLFSLEGIDRAAYLDMMDAASRTTADAIRRWDRKDIHHLVELLAVLDDLSNRIDRQAEDYVTMSNLPSAPIPPGVDTAYPVWALDAKGMALVGEGADEVEPIKEVAAYCAELRRREKGIPTRCHKCGHSWLYRGRSLFRTTCPACHVTVYLSKCEISHTELADLKRDR